MTGPSTKLEAGALIASRYRAEEPRFSERTRRAYTGTDEQSGQTVLLVEVAAGDAGSLGPMLRVEHQHLARLLDVVQLLGSTVVVVEHIEGETLEAHAGAPLASAVDAVRSALRIADAVSAVHAAGGAHGCLGPAAIVHAPVGRAGPVVSFAPPVIGLSPYRSPQRGEAGPPSEADDAWAVGGLLYSMLTGKEPPVSGIGSESDLEDAGIGDPLLRSTLLHSLARDAAQRSSDLKTLKRELARWFVDHAGEEHTPHVGVSSRPPPLPPSVSPPPPGASVAPVAGAGAVAAPPKRRGKLVLGLAVAGIVLGLGAAWAVSSLRKPQVEIVERPASAAPEASGAPGAHAIDLSEVPVTGEEDAATGDKTATCVAGYLPKGAFVVTPSFDWLCSEADARTGSERLRTAVVQGGGQREVTEAMKIFSRLGWYDMAAFAVVRSGCCPDAKPLEMPEPVEGCADVGQALRDIAKNVHASQAFDEPLERFGKGANCEVNANRAYLYRHTGKPQHYQELAFRELIKAFQSP